MTGTLQGLAPVEQLAHGGSSAGRTAGSGAGQAAGSGAGQAAGSGAGQTIRVVVVGKGGVGKTTVTALLARQFARLGHRVVAVDADEQQNLAATLGMEPASVAALVPVTEDAAYVEEKTGARPAAAGAGAAGAGGMLRLNPDVTDVIERLSILGPDGVRLLVMGSVRHAGAGCLCPEHALVSATVAKMGARRGQVVLMDTHAGVEHFGRALARGFDQAVVVVDPSFNGVQVGLEAARLARELGIPTIRLVVNRVRRPHDLERVMSHFDLLGGLEVGSAHVLPFDGSAEACEPSVEALLEGSLLGEAVRELGYVLAGGVASLAPMDRLTRARRRMAAEAVG